MIKKEIAGINKDVNFSDDFYSYNIDVDFLEKLSNFIPSGLVIPIFTPVPINITNLNIILQDFGFIVCDGSEPNDPDSLIYDAPGKHLPNLTNNIFLMGYVSSNTLGGSNYLSPHGHTCTFTYPQVVFSSSVSTNHSGQHGTQTTYIYTAMSIMGLPINTHAHTHTVRRKWLDGSAGGPWDGQEFVRTLSDDDYAHTCVVAYSTDHSHRHTWYARSQETYPSSISFNHSHNVYIDLSQPNYVGSDGIPTDTYNIPSFLGCYFIIKHKTLY